MEQGSPGRVLAAEKLGRWIPEAGGCGQWRWAKKMRKLDIMISVLPILTHRFNFSANSDFSGGGEEGTIFFKFI